MNNHTKPETLHGAANILVLAPLTPDGNRAHMKLVGATPADKMRLAAVTYTQHPQRWLADWSRHIGPLPHETYFIHASGMAYTESTDEQTPETVTTEIVDPTDPMEIIVSLSQELQAWPDNELQLVVSLQTLTVLLEYIDFDTAFRYLHVLTHRIRAAGATCYFQMDPEIHDAETTNTLKSLFDVVVEISNGNVEWTPISSGSLGTDTGDTSDTTKSPISTEQPDGCLLASIRTVLSTLLDRDESNADQVESSVTISTAVPDTDSEDKQSPLSDLVDEEMLTDEERIRSLLIQYGGRMKQADITAETPWSKSTVSRKLRKMEEDGIITRVQLGRENLIFLNGSEPDATKSPFEV